VASSISKSRSRRRLRVVPAKRLLALDPGSHSVKYLVVEETFGRLRFYPGEIVEVRESSLRTEEAALEHLKELVQGMVRDPVALALPHYRALSQVVDLPRSDESEVRQAIESEMVELSGLDESNISFDYAPLEPFGNYGNPFWVTVCRENEVALQTERCGLSDLDLCEVTTTANALVTAYQRICPDERTAVLVDFGASGTTVAILYRGQPAYATNFPIGGDALTEALTQPGGVTSEVAEEAKRCVSLGMDSPEATALKPVIAEWYRELDRIISEWLGENRSLPHSQDDLPIVLSGGTAELSGLTEDLNSRGRLRFSLWPSDAESRCPGGRFAIACGVAVQALGRNPQAVSLLPNEIRDFWRGHHSLNLLHSLIVFLMATVGLALGLGTWQKLELAKSKAALLERSEDALHKAQTAEALARSANETYNELRPVLEKQQRTLDALNSLALLENTHSNQDSWFVLFADQQSYFSAPPWNPTNRVTSTNLVSGGSPDSFVAEIVLPEKGEEMRQNLRRLVSQLNESPLTRNVDLLAEDRRRALVDPELLLPGQHFTIDIEPAQSLLYPGSASNETASSPEDAPGGDTVEGTEFDAAEKTSPTNSSEVGADPQG